MTVAAASQYERTNLYILCPANNWLFSQRTSLHVREEKYICLYYIDTTISKSQNKQTNPFLQFFAHNFQQLKIATFDGKLRPLD